MRKRTFLITTSILIYSLAFSQESQYTREDYVKIVNEGKRTNLFDINTQKINIKSDCGATFDASTNTLKSRRRNCIGSFLINDMPSKDAAFEFILNFTFERFASRWGETENPVLEITLGNGINFSIYLDRTIEIKKKVNGQYEKFLELHDSIYRKDNHLRFVKFSDDIFYLEFNSNLKLSYDYNNNGVIEKLPLQGLNNYVQFITDVTINKMELNTIQEMPKNMPKVKPELEEVKIGYINQADIAKNWNSFNKFNNDYEKWEERFRRGKSAYSEEGWRNVMQEGYYFNNANWQDSLSIAIKNTALEKNFDAVIDKYGVDGPIYFLDNNIFYNRERDLTLGLTHPEGKRIVFLNFEKYIKISKFQEEWNKLVSEYENENNLMIKEFEEKAKSVADPASGDALKKEYEDKMALKQQQLFGPIIRRYKLYVLEETRNEPYSLIIETFDQNTSDHQLFYVIDDILSNKSLDITNLVLKELNK